MNAVDQWMTLLGFKRQADLARALRRGDEAVSRWKKEGRMPPAAVRTLELLAETRGVEVPDHLSTRETPAGSDKAA